MVPTHVLEADEGRVGYPAHVGKGHDQADGPVAAHSEVADIVEENDTSGAHTVQWLDKKRAHDPRSDPARFIDDGRAKAVVSLAERFSVAGATVPAPKIPGRRKNDKRAWVRRRCANR